MKAKKLVRKRLRAASRRRSSSDRPKTVKVRFGRLGSELRELQVPADTTVKDLVKAEGLEKLSVRINRQPVRLASRLREGDIIVAVPPFVVGGSAGRHDHLDLEECRRTMSPRDFKFFANFVGADRLGFRDEDLEPC